MIMADWCKSCKYYGESSLSYPCAICERAYDNAPTKHKEIDVVPVVRCRDCFHFEPYGHRDAVGVCKLNNNSEWRGEEDYCSKWHEDGD